MTTLGNKPVEFRTLARTTEWQLYVVRKELDQTSSRFYALEWHHMFLKKELDEVRAERDQYKRWYQEVKESNSTLLQRDRVSRALLLTVLISTCVVGAIIWLTQLTAR